MSLAAGCSGPKDFTLGSSNSNPWHSAGTLNAPVVTGPGASPYTSNSSPIHLAGTCDDGSSVVLVSGGAAQTVPCSGSAFAMSVPESADGVYDLVLAESDGSGNQSATTDFNWTLNTSIPSTPTITTPASSPVTTNAGSQTIAGACTDGDTVNLAGDSVQSATCASSAFSFSVPKSSDGTYNFSVSQSDALGNTSPNATAQWVRDTVAPSAPTVTSPTSNGSYTSNGNSITLSGACETGATVNLTGASTQSTSCAASAYSFSVSKASDATYNFSLAQTDPAGNASGSTSYAWTRNTSAPPVPVISSPASSPAYTNGSSLTISGTCVTGDTINMTGASTGSTACVASAFSFNVSKATDNSYAFTFKQQDGLGNVSAGVTQQWVRDTVAPAAPTVTAPSSNPYSSPDTTLPISGGCENAATVAWTGDATGSVVCASSSYSLNLTESADGSYVVHLKQTDRAGNVSGTLDFNWTRDTTIPPTPTFTAPAANPYYSNGSALTLAGTCQTGNTVTLSGVSAGEVTGGSLTYTCAANAFTYQINESTDGSRVLEVIQTDAASNDSSPADLTWNRDTVAPAKPTITNPASNPFTSSGNLTISGACENAATVNLTGDSTQSTTCASSSYSFSFSPGVDGTYNFTVGQSDRAGNASPTASQQWVRDSTAPATPTIDDPGSTPYLSNDSVLTLDGSCETGDTVTLGGNVVAGDVTSPAGSLTETCVSGSYSYDISKIDGSYTFTVKQTDGAGNSSGTASQDWTRDTVPPVTSITANPPATNLSQSASFSFSVSDTSGTITECDLDGGGFSTCTSPVALSGLSNGSHTFTIRSTDDAGNVEPSPPAYTWTQAAYNAIALYHFDSGTGAMADSSSYVGGYNNGLTNSSSTNSAGAKFSQGEQFASASSQYAYVADTATQELISSTATFEAWIKMTTLPTASDAIVSKMGASGSMGWEFGVMKSSSSYKLYLKGSTNGTTATSKKSAAISGFATGTWYHVAATYNKGAITFYVNGASLGTASLGSNVSLHVPTTQNMQVGRTTTGANYFNGIIDELRVSQVVRWTGAFTPPSSAYSPD